MPLNWFRSPATKEAPERVDREKGVIYGVAVMTEGDVESHEIAFDSTTRHQIVHLGQKSRRGVKARFTHPGMSDDGLGTYVGRFKDFRHDGTKARADLHLADIAFESPKGDLGSYLLDLAEEDPEAFGASMVIKYDREERPALADGTPQLPLARVERLHAIDAVDTPAANAGLFADDTMPDFPSRGGERILANLAEHFEPDEVRHRVMSFVDRYFAKGDRPMPEPTEKKTETQAPAPAATPVAITAQLSLDEQKKLIADATRELLAAEQTRQRDILTLCNKHRMNQEFALGLVAEGLSVDQASARILNELAEQQKKTALPFNPQFESGEASLDKFAAAAGTALVLRSLATAKVTPERQAEIHPESKRGAGWQDFKHARLIDLARESLSMFGVNTRVLAAETIARAALCGSRGVGIDGMVRFSGDYGFHVTGSFPNLTLDAINKTLLAAYTERPMTWRTVFRVAPSVPDFKQIHRIALSEAPNLEIWPGGQNLGEAAFTDEKESYAVEAYGKETSFDWRMLVNDDMGAISRVPQLMGAAARRSENAHMWSKVILGLSVNMSDGQPVFSAATGNRKQNNIGSTAAVTKASLGEARKIMRLMAGRNTKAGNVSEAILNLEAKYLVIPAAIETVALEMVMSLFDPTIAAANTVNPGGVVNQFRNLQVVVEPLLDGNSATRWFMFADSADIDTFEMTYLQGQETPVTNQWEDPRSWAVKYQIVQTYQAAPIDYRGCFTNAGA